ncbi:MAG: hypothetical protein ACI8QS_003186 [Planctomycetota bacterium]|jgi:hypothetical protein
MPVFIAKKELQIACLFEPEKNAPRSDAFFARINYEGYLSCQPEERERFLARSPHRLRTPHGSL